MSSSLNNINNLNHPNHYNHLSHNTNPNQFHNPSNPYGITFENRKEYERNEKTKYKEDLDYLIWLKQGRKADSFNQKAKDNWEIKMKLEQQKQQIDNSLYESKRNQSDLLNIQKNLMYEQEERKRHEKNFEKEQDKRDLELRTKDFVDCNKDKKEKWNKIANDEYVNYHMRKQERSIAKINEEEANLKIIEEQNKAEQLRSKEYKNMMNSKNNQIYKNLINYSGYLANNNIISSNEPYHLMNDKELNKYVADQKERERLALKKDGSGGRDHMLLKSQMLNEEMSNKERKLGSQKAYKDFLDKQYLELQQAKNPIKESYNCDLMPGYKYPSLPIPLYKKAKDSIHMVKNNILFENQNVDMKEFFTNDVQNHTMLDQHDKRHDLGSFSNLKRNVIVNPIDSADNEHMKKVIDMEKGKLKHQGYGGQLYGQGYGQSKESRRFVQPERRIENDKTDLNINQMSQSSLPQMQTNNLNNQHSLGSYGNTFKQGSNQLNLQNQDDYSDNRDNLSYQNFRYENDKKQRTPHNNYNYSPSHDQISSNYYYNPNNPNSNPNQNSINFENNIKPYFPQTYPSPHPTILSSNTRLMSTSKDNVQIKKFASRLKQKGVLGIFKMRQFLEKLDPNNTLMVDITGFTAFFREFYMGYNTEDCKSLFNYLDDNKTNRIRYEELISAVIGELSEPRRSLINDLYTRLSSVFGDKFVEEQVIKSKFDPQLHPDVIALRKNGNEVLVEFINDFNLFFYKTRVSF